MPGLGELILFAAVPLLLLYGAYRLGYRVGKAEGRLQGRDDTEDRQRSA
jgi:hypothetical protein